MPTRVAGEEPMKSPKMAKGKMDHMRIYKAENGGHMIEHHLKPEMGMGMREPIRHVFGPEEGPEAHDHIEQHIGMEQEEMGEEGVTPAEGASEQMHKTKEA